MTKTQKFTIEVTSITGIDLIDPDRLRDHLDTVDGAGRWWKVDCTED